MREIKFRCWDKKTKKMRQVTEIVFNTGFYMESNDNSVKLIWVKGQDIIENKEIQIQREKDFILMQYTGLHDKNGKEIYEGDIVKVYFKKDAWINNNKECGYKNGIIEYCVDCFIVYIKNYKDKIYPLSAFGSREIKYLEVIGNIYDNPELLEE